jgi:predicted nucleic acid-binding protein
MDRLIVDASMAVAWIHPGQATPQSNALLAEVGSGTTLVQPALWPIEVANVLLVLERRGKLTRSERTEALETLSLLDIQIDHEMSALAFTRLSQLALDLGLSVYDAAYVELALRLKLPLASKVVPLREAARKRRVTVLPRG